MFRRLRIRHLLCAVTLVTAPAVATYGSPAAANPADDTTSSVFSTQSLNSATDWQSAIPSVYMAGIPVQWTSVVTQGVRWTPTVIRIERGGSYFAFFSTPNGRLWAASEDDDLLWVVDDYYDTSTWHPATLADAYDNGVWLAEFIILLVKIVIALAVLFAVVLSILILVWIWKAPKTPKGRRNMEQTQIEAGAWRGNPSWFTETFNAEPDFRAELGQYPGLIEHGANVGYWTMP